MSRKVMKRLAMIRKGNTVLRRKIGRAVSELRKLTDHSGSECLVGGPIVKITPFMDQPI
jgi:hypothetical protein